MSYKPGDSFATQFFTESPTTGALQDADLLPVATATRNQTDDAGFVLSVAHMNTGRYQVRGTIPLTYAAGDTVSITALATVAGIQGGLVLSEFVLDGFRLSDLAAKVGGQSGVVLAPNGMDQVITEGLPTPMNHRQATAIILASAANKLAGATPNGGTVTIFDPSGTAVRIVAITDNNGNRNTTTLTPPA